LIDPKGEIREATAIGTGPVDAIYKAIDLIVENGHTLQEFVIQAITEGIDAVGEVSVRIERNRVVQDAPRRTFTGHGSRWISWWQAPKHT